LGHKISAPDIGVIQKAGWIITIIGTGLALIDSRIAAMSLFYGGALSNLSFYLLKRDLLAILGGSREKAKGRFLIRHYLKLSVIVVVLFLLVKNNAINKLYLLLGLGATVGGIVIATALRLVRGEKNLREA